MARPAGSETPQQPLIEDADTVRGDHFVEVKLERRSGHQANPRILGAFNERRPDWLSFTMFTYSTDRDGKMQLAVLAESGFDPPSRSCHFMLTEEAHHLFVGETGVQRTIEATCTAMKKAGVGDWLPNDEDNAFIHSLMKPCHAPGQYASWIAPPRVGINGQPGEFEYVKIA